ncbi:hypothetical protein K8R66_00430 [bacterium]|nr:hypothetical protein [bacterium]
MFLSKIFKNKSDRIMETCISIYQKAKKKKPNRSERDYLKIVLLTKPPFDYLPDKIINFTLDTFDNINDLATYIITIHRDKTFWFFREKSLKYDEKNIKLRNLQFFNEFWGDEDSGSSPE